MIYKEFKGIRLSRLGMGNMRLPSLNGKKGEYPLDYPESHKMID